MDIPIAFDYETFYSSKLKHSVRVSIAEQYCRSELFDVYMIAVCDGTSAWSGHPRDFTWSALHGKVLLAHNAYFEKNVTMELERRGTIPPLLSKIKALHCTANMSAYLCNLRALDQAAEKLLDVKVDKSARSDANGKRWPQDFSEEQQRVMLDYARKDAQLCWDLFDKHGHKWPAHERELSRLTIDQGIYGIRINRDLLDDFILRAFDMLDATKKVLPWLAAAEDDEDESWDSFNTKPTSTKCIAEQCRRDGIPCAPVKADDEDAYDEWEQTYAASHPWILAVGAWRTVNRLYKTFQVLKQRLRDDDTVPFELKYFAAHTGRWGGGSKFNLQNMPKRAILCNEHGLLETNAERIDAAFKERDKTGSFPSWVRHGIDLRNLIIPRTGMKMITSDLSQIEPRVLSWLSGDTQLLASMAAGNSPYQAHAIVSMKFMGVDLKKEDPEMYTLAKARVLALGYGAGYEKFVTMAKLYGLDITKDDPEFVEEMDRLTGQLKKVSGFGFTSKRIVKEYREQNPLIVAMWKRLDEMFKRSVGEDFVMSLPSGRKMRYERVRCEARLEKDKETGKPVKKTVFTAQIGSKRVITYGGKLTENITQAVARDVLAECLLALSRESHRILFHVHDEAVLEVPEEVTVEQINTIMSRPVSWLPGCQLAAETNEVDYYQK
jgi:DNA polymerase